MVDHPNSLPFVVLTAFANDIAGGNPAAVVFLKEDLPRGVLKTIAGNFNQPITVFLSQRMYHNPIERSATFGIRYFISPPSEKEPPLCGHGTLAAAQAIFADGNLVPKEVDVLRFQTTDMGVVTARKVEGGQVEISLPSTTTEEVAAEEQERLRPVLAKALNVDHSAVKFMARGGKGFEIYFMVELDATVDLGKLKVDFNALRGTNYVINVVTTSSPTSGTHFLSRMFAPLAEVNEDPVCGTAHCLLGPYWITKLGLAGVEVKAKQVSPRGGDLRLIWEAEKGIVRLRGESKQISKGEIFL